MVDGSTDRTYSAPLRIASQPQHGAARIGSRAVLPTAAQAHPPRKTRRKGPRQSQNGAARPQKKALRKNAAEALLFQDETEIHLHPLLTRMWARIGCQPRVPSPGQNQKKTVYGAVDYATGKITTIVTDTKSGLNFIAFLATLLRSYGGRKIRLVCDNARYHHTGAVQDWLDGHRHRIEVYWLPPYCPDLNLIERLWGHLKRTALANVLFAGIHDLVRAFVHGVRAVNGHRDKMGFMFDHDDAVRTRAA
ncbi:MAG: IS630 family transposase [Planctomycetes bacterium]|nr:IS630 family transposase [Planctomycetota bacterium]